MAPLKAFIFIDCWSVNRVAFGYNIEPLPGIDFRVEFLIAPEHDRPMVRLSEPLTS
jgi:hypothetical protein